MPTAAQKLDAAAGFDGREVERGDTVMLLLDNSSARVADIALDGGEAFFCLRPLHMPYGKGYWHAADRVVFQSKSKRTKKAK